MWYDARSLALLLDFTNLSGTVKVTALSQTGHASAGNMHSYDVHVAHMCGSTPVDTIDIHIEGNSQRQGVQRDVVFLAKGAESLHH